jgi:hypothetical protein
MHGLMRGGGCGAVLGIALLWGSAAMAQTQPAPTSAGPGRIVCQAANKCQIDIGTPPTNLRYKVDATGLADADKDRLVKQCTAKGTPCVATVTGPESKLVIKATTIKFYN